MSVNDHRTQPTTEEFEVMHGPNDHSATYIFGNEDHTLGNVLRYVLMQREETSFCGYSVPHPYEPKMNVRLQTEDTAPALEVLKTGLKDLDEVCNILDDRLSDALLAFDERKEEGGAKKATAKASKGKK
jgi:DNA-directed RNA polymerases I and III subunit RPAC2